MSDKYYYKAVQYNRPNGFGIGWRVCKGHPLETTDLNKEVLVFWAEIDEEIAKMIAEKYPVVPEPKHAERRE